MTDTSAMPGTADAPDQPAPPAVPDRPDGPTGPAAATAPAEDGAPDVPGDDGTGAPSSADTVFGGSPAKVMRIGTMVKQLLEEVRSAPLDTAARARLAEVHDRSLQELEDGLSPDLVAELRRITLPFTDDAEPSDAELRVAQAQLVGWLEGLFHGLQTALVAQQMSSQAQQLAQLRRALPPGSVPPGAMPPGAALGQPHVAGEERPGPEERHPGQYL